VAVLKRKHVRILGHGKIKSDEEFYIVSEILSDLELDISDADRTKLRDISGEYESSRHIDAL
jgi:hypothetical protein